jgi:hypothetical protein
MAVRRYLLVVAAFVFALLLSAYLYMHSLWSASMQRWGKVSVSDECEDGTGAQQTSKINPNKMLFISCGGFLD